MSPQPIIRRIAFGGIAAVAALALAACSGGGSADAGSSAIDSVDIIVPADPGGGWDQTGRALGQAATGSGTVKSAPVSNIGGAGGTVGLASLATEKDPNTLMITGSVMVGAVETNASADRIEDMTPIAKLTEEPLVVVVPADSPYESIGDLLDGWVEEGAGMAITGGSAGGIDHILAGMLLLEAGVTADEVPDTLNYIANSGGGEALTMLLGGQVDAGISGVGEFAEQVEAGKLRALAVSSGEPAELLPDVPTLTDEGVAIELTNWRGLIAPGGIGDDEKAALVETVDAIHSSDEWTELVETNGWTDAYLTGSDFDEFLAADIATTQETLHTIGLLE
ncbi:Bug family tripartite tricarboxylate transporter substrate binding protein [Agromyces archimandritae]|uniref:Tripartite tricarboxylate transporter substrate binding protein n=1 Tax=Agromyces archimandritae TaxID=2781962 RepID=A0A975FKV1_9MICO|nr:tripartite tricarboxylate transporter substrate-binding protein [Agromyces archimandritae]QTX03777.1 tripartite tricarboxylate transporter substrate binding protein [Agromyces archimandritae]